MGYPLDRRSNGQALDPHPSLREDDIGPAAGED